MMMMIIIIIFIHHKIKMSHILTYNFKKDKYKY